MQLADSSIVLPRPRLLVGGVLLVVAAALSLVDAVISAFIEIWYFFSFCVLLTMMFGSTGIYQLFLVGRWGANADAAKAASIAGSASGLFALNSVCAVLAALQFAAAFLFVWWIIAIVSWFIFPVVLVTSIISAVTWRKVQSGSTTTRTQASDAVPTSPLVAHPNRAAPATLPYGTAAV